MASGRYAPISHAGPPHLLAKIASFPRCYGCIYGYDQEPNADGSPGVTAGPTYLISCGGGGGPIPGGGGGTGGGGTSPTIGPPKPPPSKKTCVQPNFLNNLEIPILQKIASANNETVGIGLSVGAGAGSKIGFAGGGSAFLVVTPSGEAGFVVTVGSVPAFGPVTGIGALGGPAFLQSSATSLSQLGGWSVDFGVNGADGLGFAADGSVSTGGVVTTVSTAGFGLGGNGHAAVIQSSTVTPICR